MILVKVTSGLGNQLFQYALARRLAHEQPAEVCLETSFYGLQRHTRRTYLLDRFNISLRVATPEESVPFVSSERRYRWRRRLHNLRVAYWQRMSIRERGHFYDPHMLQVRAPAYLVGFWQSEKYFKAIESVLRDELQVTAPLRGRNQALADQIAEVNAVALHVRRGDYVSDARNAARYGVLPLDYFRQAVERMAAQISDLHLFIFSDDSDWVQANLQFPFPMHFVLHNGDEHPEEDLRLMSLCKHHIIPNSTFSWWGAWLGAHPGQRVIAPNRWFMDPTLYSLADRCPADWELLDVTA